MPEAAAASTAPADGNRKRSRSASDSDQHKIHKRANTGAPTSSQTADESTRAHESLVSASESVPTARAAALNDVPMSDAPYNGDTAASTPTATAAAVADDAKHDASKSETDSSQAGSGQMSGSTAAGPTSASSTGAGSQTPSAMIHMRCLIVTQDASIIIGRGGKHVNEIREKSGARVIVSESIPGNPERILNVSGALDAVSKVCLLIVPTSPTPI